MNIYDEISKISSEVQNQRTLENVLVAIMEETGEIAAEVRKKNKTKTYKEFDKENLLEESVDLLICSVDFINLIKDELNFNEEDIHKMLHKKLNKWKTFY